MRSSKPGPLGEFMPTNGSGWLPPPVHPCPVAGSHSDLEAAKFLGDAYAQLQGELGKVIVGQTRVIEEILRTCFAEGPARARKLYTLYLFDFSGQLEQTAASPRGR